MGHLKHVYDRQMLLHIHTIQQHLRYNNNSSGDRLRYFNEGVLYRPERRSDKYTSSVVIR